VAHAWVLQGAVLGSLESPRKMEPRYFQVGPMFEPLPSGATLAEKDPFGVRPHVHLHAARLSPLHSHFASRAAPSSPRESVCAGHGVDRQL
jgi:hypothetical protein